MTGSYWLSVLVFFPLFGAILIAMLPASAERAIRRWAAAVALVEMLFSLPLWWRYQPNVPGFQFVENIPWIPALGANYHLGVDGVSVLLVLLTTVLTAVALIGAFSAVDKRHKEFYALLLLLESGMLGTFLSLDLLLFYVFWEVMLIPMYLLIGVWGGPRRIYAAIKFFLYTMAGSVLMLAALLWLYFHHKARTGVATFDLEMLYQLPLDPSVQVWLFLAFALAFAIKVPMFPFHTWLPDAHVEAPTAGSVILAGVLLKMGTYGFLRFSLPILPEATRYFLPWALGLALVGVIYGAMVALMQSDWKKLVAYSSVSHLGLTMVGIFALNHQGITGGVLQMLNHGLSTGALFLLVGIVYERRHTRRLDDYGGLWKVMPVFAVFFLLMTLSSIGMPFLPGNGFVGEFVILVGAFQLSNKVWAVLAATGIVLGAVYMLWLYQRTMFGKLDREENRGLTDLSLRELATLLPLVALAFWIGVYPKPFFAVLEEPVDRLVQQVEQRYVFPPEAQPEFARAPGTPPELARAEAPTER